MEYVINGKKIKVLFPFEINQKKYLAYLTDKNEITASILEEDGLDMNLLAITDDKEWQMVEKVLEERI